MAKMVTASASYNKVKQRRWRLPFGWVTHQAKPCSQQHPSLPSCEWVPGPVKDWGRKGNEGEDWAPPSLCWPMPSEVINASLSYTTNIG